MKPGIIVPFRNREEHLKISAPVLKRFGQVYVIEQVGKSPFNRGKLINAGFLEFKKEFDYFIAHDVDMIPEEADYSFCENPCHLARRVEQFNYGVPYEDYFGGVTLIPNSKFEDANGFSNSYWGWGGEDDELKRRFLSRNIKIENRNCKFKSLHHNRNIDKTLLAANRTVLKQPVDWANGLSSCEYEVVHCEDFENYTLLQVKL